MAMGERLPVDKQGFGEPSVSKSPVQVLELIVNDDIETRRARGGDVSEAHSIQHLRNVARLAKFVGTLYGYTQKEQMLVQAAGLFHDLVRSPSEDPAIKDEEASAKAAKAKLEELDNVREVSTTGEERDAIAHAIVHQTQYPTLLSDPSTREKPPESLQDKVWLALFVADKLEANGVRVIARRSSFVTGDRLQKEDGDWRQFGFKPQQDEGKVVAIESMVRLAIINPEEVYPQKLKPLVGPLYQVQREFVLGLCKGLGLGIKDLAEILINTKNKDGKNILEVRKLKAPNNVAELTNFIKQRGTISEEAIQAASSDNVTSSMETVDYFSQRYKDDLEGLMTNWRPNGATAKRWQADMVDYANGEWFDRMESDIKGVK